MNDDSLHQATVPVFRHYLDRIDALATRPGARLLLEKRLAPHMLSAGENLRTAQGYILRTICPLTGVAAPELSTEETDPEALWERSAEIRGFLAGITPADFAGATTRRIRHLAGQADLEQAAVDFTTLYALPNFFFHVCMAYAVLRSQGLDIGKGDFDGHHAYPRGFHF